MVDIPITGDEYGVNVLIDQGISGRLIGGYLCNWLAEDPTRVANVGYIVGQYIEQPCLA